jgi:hypothetical protein
MTKLKLFGAAALVASSALASPVMAQQVVTNPGRCAQFYPNANCQNLGPGNPYTGDYQRRAAYQQNMAYGRAPNPDTGWNDNQWDHRYNSGFWPGDVAAGVVGGAAATAGAAIGTAGAIATAPFRNDAAYAYYNGGYNNAGYNGYYGWNNNWDSRTYAQRNGFVCQPGTWFKGDDGLQHLCQ